MVALDESGTPVRDALLWNDTRSAGAARDLVDEMGGPQACADAIGSVLVASFTSTKLRWLRDHEPERAARVHRVLLPHDFVSHHLSAPGTDPFTDRGDASGTGYFATREGSWRPDLLEQALGHAAELPRLVAPATVAAHDDERCRRGRRHGRQHGCRPRHGPPARRRPRVGRHLRRRVRSEHDRGRRRHRRGDRVRRRQRRLPPDGHHHERRRDPRPAGPVARCGPRRAGRPRPRVVRGRRRCHPAALLRRRTQPQPARRRRHLDRAPPDHDARRPRAGGVRGAAVLARRRRRPTGPGDRRATHAAC